MSKVFWLEQRFKINLPAWTVIAPVLAFVLLAIHLVAHPTGALVYSLTAVGLIGAVFSAVHHAEVIAHKVGEPFGTLVLAVAVTIIEVALIVVLMSSSSPEDRAVLARDTVYSAVMIVCNAIVGLCLLTGGLRNYIQGFELEGVKKAVSVLLILALMVFMLPNFTTSLSGGSMLNSQLIFLAVCCLVMYGAFLFTQTIRHRNYFVTELETQSHHSDNMLTIALSGGLLLVGLVTVVGLAKMLSPLIESTLVAMGLPKVVLGIIIAGLVLLPESIAAVKAAYNDQLQNSLNLALGSALASISLTIPVIAIYGVVTGNELILGLSPKDDMMLMVTLLLLMNTLSTGKSTFLQGVMHLVMFATFIFFSIVP
ncbi:calcium:proton antiporter [Faucicola mancuniensis]|uniref:calcium:proton antiporter n=1 Tax=Faucicola mancuniensis TaxID=1309795 RepID=UPI0039772A4A